MGDSEAKKNQANTKTAERGYALLIAISLCALGATFLVSILDSKFETKFLIFASIVISYLLICLSNYYRQRKDEANSSAGKSDNSIFDDEIERKLYALEEVNRFFGASLKSNDMFRLIANRVSEIVPFAALTLYLVEKDKSKLEIVHAVGENSQIFTGTKISSDDGIAGRAFQTARVQVADDLKSEKKIFAGGKLKNLHSAIAAPLAQNGKTYGVLVLYSAGSNLNRKSQKLFEAVGERVAPIFANSRVFEENLSSAMVDMLTKLPNERAFYMVLENQLAEAQRFRDKRSLTILTMDIKDFDELNLRYGHSTGDALLEYAAEMIKGQLRQMDFLARSTGDEFLAVLPTASDQITLEIISRIEKTFVSKPFVVSTRETINLELKFGAASFWHDGEIAVELLKTARLRKDQTKNADNGNILWFPKEYVN